MNGINCTGHGLTSLAGDKMIRQFDMVRVKAIRDTRFVGTSAHYERVPQIGDVGAVLELYSEPELGYEIECSNPANGFTIWLEAMYPDEIERVGGT